MSRNFKRTVTLLVDTAISLLSFIFSMKLTTESYYPYVYKESIYIHASVTIIVSITLLMILGFYRTVNRFIGLSILGTIGLAAALSSSIYYLVAQFLDLKYISITSSILFGSSFYILLSASRLLVKSYFSTRFNTQKKRIIIYGAGAAGRQLATSLFNGTEYYPVAFVDDDKAINGVVIQGLKVFNSENLTTLVNNYDAELVLLALPSISRAQRKHIIGRVEEAGVAVQTVPGMADIVSGKMKIDEFQDVEIEDLLGRDPVPPVKKLFKKNITNKVILVTGAGGSIGSELCRQIVMLKPKALILFDVSEFALYQIDKELKKKGAIEKLNIVIKPILGTVLDRDKVRKIITYFGVQTVYHAAAYKHVPMVEHNVVEGIRNNIFGTLNVACTADEAGVESFVLISTDKAVRPTNVMGATKRFAELVCQAIATRESNTCFSMVRFGNVLGSSGSVIPAFKEQIKNGGPVTVTHPDIIRYFMTIPEAAQLVIQAGAMAKGGDVFVLDMGEPVKIVELAKKLILLMGLELKSIENPDGDIEIVYSGLRPGEKLYEELLIGNNVEGTTHPRIMTANEKLLMWEEMLSIINKLDACCLAGDIQGIRDLLLEAPADYSPNTDIEDYLWSKPVESKSSDSKIVKLK